MIAPNTNRLLLCVQLYTIRRAIRAGEPQERLARQLMPNLQDKLRRDIEEFGWHVLNVFSERAFPPHSYSIGLYETYGHPELVIVGLKAETAQTLVNNVGEEIRDGAVFSEGTRYGHILAGFDIAVVRVDKSHYDAYLGQAIDYYESQDFPVLQLVWPDRNRCFPWEPAFDPSLFSQQPVLTLSRERRSDPRPEFNFEPQH